MQSVAGQAIGVDTDWQFETCETCGGKSKFQVHYSGALSPSRTFCAAHLPDEVNGMLKGARE